MIRQIKTALLFLTMLPAAVRAQEGGHVTGSLESNSIYYQDDAVVGRPASSWGSNNYLKVDWSRGGFGAGLQAEWYPEASTAASDKKQ